MRSSINCCLLASSLALVGLAACDATSPQDIASDVAAVHIASPTEIPIFTFGFNAAWDDLGMSNFGGVPSVSTWGPGRLDVFQRDGEALLQKTWGPGWIPGGTPWTLAHGLASDPSAAGWGGGDPNGGQNIEMVWRDTQNHVQHLSWAGHGWTQTDIDGRIDGRPTISVQADGYRADVFARAAGTIWHRAWVFARGSWMNGWENLGIPADGDPVAVSSGRGHIDLFLRGADGQTNQWAWDGSTDSTRYYAPLAGHFVAKPTLGGYAKSAPAVTSRGGVLVVFVQGGDDGIYYREMTSQGWSSWIGMGLCTRGAPAVTAWSGDRLDLFVHTKDDGRILHDFEILGPSSVAGQAPTCCGRDGQRACSYNGCDPDFRRSASNTCDAVPCGILGGRACSTGRKCQPGLTANLSNYCTSCGDLNGFCCAEDPNQCNRGLCGHDNSLGIDTCNHCGSLGEVACPNNQAACLTPDMAASSAGVCEHCGGMGEVACTTGAACSDNNATRGADGRCTHCGNMHEPSCGGRCDEVHTHDVNGTCEYDNWCGHDGQACCQASFNGGTCFGDLTCIFNLGSINTCGHQTTGGGGGAPNLCTGGQQPRTYCTQVTCLPGNPFGESAYACTQESANTIVQSNHAHCTVDPANCG